MWGRVVVELVVPKANPSTFAEICDLQAAQCGARVVLFDYVTPSTQVIHLRKCVAHGTCPCEDMVRLGTALAQED